MATAALAPGSIRTAAVVLVTMVALAMLGALGARLGGAPARRAMARVLFGGAAAMAVTYGIGTAL